MSLVLIRQALETHLNAITPAIPTAWENVPFTPAIGTPYQQVNLVIAGNKDVTVSDASYEEFGFMQVTLIYPIGTGAKAAEQRVDLLRTHFPRGLILSAGGLNVLINKTPTKSSPLFDGKSYKTPVTIHFKTFISL